MCEKKTTKQAVYDCLVRNGPMTSAQVAGNIKRNLAGVKVALSVLHSQHQVFMHLDKWQVRGGIPRYPGTSAWTKGPPLKDAFWGGDG